MSEPVLERTEDGGFRVRNMTAVLAWSLRELPRLLSEEAPGIADRVCPTPHPEDEEATEEWVRLNAPELAHLFRSARDLVVGDLESLDLEGDGFTIEIPERHRTAWLSALAAARVALGDAYGFEAEDMDDPLGPDIETDRDRALLLVHLLGWMQGILLEDEDPEWGG